MTKPYNERLFNYEHMKALFEQFGFHAFNDGDSYGGSRHNINDEWVFVTVTPTRLDNAVLNLHSSKSGEMDEEEYVKSHEEVHAFLEKHSSRYARFNLS